MQPITPSKLIAEIKANAHAKVPTMIWGPPGSGKSQIVYQVANELTAKLFELRANLFDPVDVRGGLKVVEQEDGTYRTRYGVPEDYPDSNYQGTVVLLIDELPNAPKATQNALLQLTLDGKIGTYTLPPNTIIVAAGNRAQDRAAVHEMPTPVKNRFAHYTLEPNIDDWIKWAVANNIDASITGFLRYRPHLLQEVDSAQNAFPTPRTWEMLNRKLPHIADAFTGCAALVGDGPATEYIAFKSIYQDLPDIDKLLKNPTTTKVPEGTSTLYAICGALSSRACDKTFGAIMKYTRRIPSEYQVIVVRDSIAKDKALVQSDHYKKWAEENATNF